MGNRAAIAATTATALTGRTALTASAKTELKRALVSDSAYNAVAGPLKAESCTITIDAEASNVSDIHIQLKDRNGDNIAYQAYVTVLVTADAAYTVNAGSTGAAQHGTPVGGVIGAGVAKGVFHCVTNSTGALDLIYTDTGSAACYIGVVFDGGYIQWSADMAHDPA